ncbi:MAG: leucine-rich repeat protein [Oscillospiraceae bacterium]|jgi:hypothetical protein|nr:leucine-rich repeat protein [Oscillospiraceae bacterium]
MKFKKTLALLTGALTAFGCIAAGVPAAFAAPAQPSGSINGIWLEYDETANAYKVTKYDEPDQPYFKYNKVFIPDTYDGLPVYKIESDAFFGAENLNEITIPATVSVIEDGPFGNCTRLLSIHVDPENEHFTSVDGVLYTKDMTEIVNYPAWHGEAIFHYYTYNDMPPWWDAVDMTVDDQGNPKNPDGIPWPPYPFGQMSQYWDPTEFLPPCTVEEPPLGYAHMRASGTWSKQWPPRMESEPMTAREPNRDNFETEEEYQAAYAKYETDKAAYDAFWSNYTGQNDPKLLQDRFDYFVNTVIPRQSYPFAMENDFTEEYTVPDTVTVIGNRAFDRSKLVKINLPDGVTDVGFSAFSTCSYLTDIELPDSVKTIGHAAFANSSSLKELNFPDSVTSLGHNMCINCTSLQSVSLPAALESIGNRAFESCIKLTEIEFPETLVSIGDSGFYSCKLLTAAPLPSSLQSLGAQAFQECASLKEMTIPAGITEIKDYTFSNCPGLTSLKFPDTLTKIGNYAFQFASSLKQVSLPDSLGSIGKSVFYNTGLEKIVIPKGVTSISEYAFANNRSLTSVKLPDGLETVGNYAFYSCEQLKNITVPDSVTDIGDYALGYVYKNRNGIASSETVPGYVIYANEGTYGEIYAWDNDIDYAEPVEQQFIAGDLNGDETVTVSDLVLLKWLTLGVVKDQVVSPLAGDIDGDKSITVFDIVLLMRVVLEG